MSNLLKSKLFFLASPLLFALISFSASSASAQIPSTLTIYRLAKSDKSASQVIEKAVEKGTEEMNFVSRPIARYALQKYALPIIHLLEVKREDDRVTVRIGKDGDLVTVKNGGTATVYVGDNEKATAKVTFTDSMITQVNTTERGIKRFDLVFSRDGSRVNMTVSIINPDKLPKPIRVTLPYKKK